MEVLDLRAIGLTVGDAQRMRNLYTNTYRAYLRDFHEVGVNGLMRVDDHDKTSPLNDHLDRICNSLLKVSVRAIAKAQRRIQELIETFRFKQ